MASNDLSASAGRLSCSTKRCSRELDPQLPSPAHVRPGEAFPTSRSFGMDLPWDLYKGRDTSRQLFPRATSIRPQLNRGVGSGSTIPDASAFSRRKVHPHKQTFW